MYEPWCQFGGAESASCDPFVGTPIFIPEFLPTADTDGKCGLGAAGSADCYEQELRDGVNPGDCPHSSNNYTIILSGTCTEVNTAQGCIIDGVRYEGLNRYGCISMAVKLDEDARRFKNNDDPAIKQIINLKNAQQAYEYGAQQNAELDVKVAEAKCQADFLCRNAGMIGNVVGAVAGVVAGAACVAATGGAGSVGCAMLGGFVGGFVGGLTTGFLEGKRGAELWAGALIGGVIGGVVGAATFGIGAGLGALAKSAFAKAVGAGVRGIGARAVKAASAASARTVSAAATGARALASGLRTVANGVGTAAQAVRAKVGSCTTAVASAAAGEVAAGALFGNSFTADTKVLTPDSQTVAIADIKVGDKVVATDPDTGQTSTQLVTAVHLNLDTDLLDLTIDTAPAQPAADNTGQGKGERSTRGPTAPATIHTTGHHPFWDATAKVNAAALKPGQSALTGPDGHTYAVTASRTVAGPSLMHDLTINNIHTYYVMAADTPVLVHNCGGSVGGHPTSCTCGGGGIDPKLVRFSQDEVSAVFSNGNTIEQTAAGLRSGYIDPGSIPTARLFVRDGNLFTLDNRRLVAFQKAGITMPFRMATPEEIAAESWKLTTKNNGVSVIINKVIPEVWGL